MDISTARGPDREIQQVLVDIAETYNLTQIHTVLTRVGNLIGLVLVTNPTLVKYPNNVPGISNHDHNRPEKIRKCYIYKKARWNQFNTDPKHTLYLNEVKEKHHQGDEVHQLWDTLKSKLKNTINTNIPYKEIRSRNNIQWIKHKEGKMLKKNRGYTNQP
ncbi:unnamed protein product [Mytilus edulis]|uniref:Uncharacterized protein n=1 Tax=Mytilus edulis TaxID=6550 RepID=A0A8S3SAN5_MYTED|nr:unnamed protein product [Mytilus edulis]